ncbi:hypothetical protein D3C76_1805680 [compost metagenome]
MHFEREVGLIIHIHCFSSDELVGPTGVANRYAAKVTDIVEDAQPDPFYRSLSETTYAGCGPS